MAADGYVLISVRLPQETIDKLDQWRMQQIGSPSRNSCIAWLLGKYLSEMFVREEQERGQ